MFSARHVFSRAVLLVTVLAAGAPAQAAWTVDFTRVGPIRIGMSVQQVNRVLGEELRQPEVPGADPSGQCFQVELKRTSGVELMFIDARLARIDVRRPGVRTARGVGVGDAESAVLSAYARRLTRSAHAYIEGGSYLTGRDAQGRHAIRFEIENARVVDFYVGDAAAVAFTEGCA